MRYNIFNQIHKALRALLFDSASMLQQTDFHNQEEAEAAIERLNMVLYIFEKHAMHEDNVILPALQQYEPSLVDTFEQEHDADHALGEKIRLLINTFNNSSSNEQKQARGQAILHAFIAFTSFNLDHMEKEETVLNERLWRYYSDKEILGLNQKVQAALTPDELTVGASWMMKGLSNLEITNWLKAVQSNAPESLFNSLFVIAEKELPYPRFRKILEDLTEGAMLA